MAWIVSVGLIGATVPSGALAASPIVLEVNGQIVRADVPPSMKNGRVMVPLRWVAEALQADVQWDGDKQAVLIDTSAKDVSGGRGRDIGVWVEGRKLAPDVPPIVQKGRTLVSVRLIAEALGAEVQWAAKERKVVVTRPEAKLGRITNVQWLKPSANWGFSRVPEVAGRLDLERKQGEALDRLLAAIAAAEPAPAAEMGGDKLVLWLDVQEWVDGKGARHDWGRFRLTVSGSSALLESVDGPAPATMFLRSTDGEVLRALEAMQALLPEPFPSRVAARTPVADATLTSSGSLVLRPVATGLPDGWYGELAIDPVDGSYAIPVTTQSSGPNSESSVWTSPDGADWRRMELPESILPGAIGFTADGVRIVSDGGSGNVYRSTRSGQDWELAWEYPLPEAIYKYPPVRYIADPANSNRVYAHLGHDTRLFTSDGLFLSEDGGRNWSWSGVNGDDRLSFGWPERAWTDPGTPNRVFAQSQVFFLQNEQTYHFASVQPDVLVSVDGGRQWGALEGIGVFYGAGVDESGASALLAAWTEGDATYLLTAGADALRWTERKLPFRALDVAFDPDSPRTIAAIGHRAGAFETQSPPELFLSFDGGEIWTSAGSANGRIELVDAEGRLLFLRTGSRFEGFHY